MSKIFFDANILLDILLPNRLNHKQAVQAYKNICEQYDTLATSENILTTIEYIASKNGTDCKIIAQFFRGLRENFMLHNFGDILEQSLILYHNACLNNEKIDFEDLLQLQCALHNKCDAFITQDQGIHKSNPDITLYCLKDFTK
jgi:predicted nucleic acid-binding protein